MIRSLADRTFQLRPPSEALVRELAAARALGAAEELKAQKAAEKLAKQQEREAKKQPSGPSSSAPRGSLGCRDVDWELLNQGRFAGLQSNSASLAGNDAKSGRQFRVERFDRRGTEPFEPFRTIRTIRILSK